MFQRMRRISAAAVAVGAVIAGTAVVAAPAEARACHPRRGMTLAGGQLGAYHYLVCGTQSTPQPIQIRRYDGPLPVNPTGTWTTVATGTGGANYQCTSSATKYWSIEGGYNSRQFACT
ncbi:hypothetical protein GCM10010123_28390 [Pilimelia anulata]|uniref:Secreted protein n=1 Tax=Pilimelia anulata TaxID=53371 RepID=A0A8J3F9D8_9ACTN|nr:hypothetical protein [Pilimelia anulata]GGJ96708.1 hypothetical protein GCM10010123_28390 [Pilimelia anulata]